MDGAEIGDQEAELPPSFMFLDLFPRGPQAVIHRKGDRHLPGSVTGNIHDEVEAGKQVHWNPDVIQPVKLVAQVRREVRQLVQVR